MHAGHEPVGRTDYQRYSGVRSNVTTRPPVRTRLRMRVRSPDSVSYDLVSCSHSPGAEARNASLTPRGVPSHANMLEFGPKMRRPTRFRRNSSEQWGSAALLKRLSGPGHRPRPAWARDGRSIDDSDFLRAIHATVDARKRRPDLPRLDLPSDDTVANWSVGNSRVQSRFRDTVTMVLFGRDSGTMTRMSLS